MMMDGREYYPSIYMKEQVISPILLEFLGGRNQHVSLRVLPLQDAFSVVTTSVGLQWKRYTLISKESCLYL